MLSTPKEALHRLNDRANTDLRAFYSRFRGKMSQQDIDTLSGGCVTFTRHIHSPALGNFTEESRVKNAMDVFWSIYEWRKAADDTLPPELPLDKEIYELLILDVMDSLYESNKVSYQPDVGRALRIRNGPELSEEALDCFREVSRVYERIRQIPAWSRHIYESVTEPSVLISTLAVTAMSYLELSRFHRREKGHYEKALGDLRLGIERYEDALWNSRLLDKSGETDWSFPEEEIAWQKRLKNLLTGLKFRFTKPPVFTMRSKSVRGGERLGRSRQNMRSPVASGHTRSGHRVPRSD